MSVKTRLLPQSNEAERALLGTILQDEDCFKKSTKFITRHDMFYTNMHRRIWNIMAKLMH